MPRRKKKPTSLPRVTLLAYNARDLLAFVEAVNKLQHLVADLLTVTERVKAKRKPQAPQPAPAVAIAAEPALF